MRPQTTTASVGSHVTYFLLRLRNFYSWHWNWSCNCNSKLTQNRFRKLRSAPRNSWQLDAPFSNRCGPRASGEIFVLVHDIYSKCVSNLYALCFRYMYILITVEWHSWENSVDSTASRMRWHPFNATPPQQASPCPSLSLSLSLSLSQFQTQSLPWDHPSPWLWILIMLDNGYGIDFRYLIIRCG